MGISVEEARRIAALARLELQPDELVQLTAPLGKILDHDERLQEVDTGSVELHLGRPAGELALRSDEPRKGLDADAALANAPDAAAQHFRVPRILG